MMLNAYLDRIAYEGEIRADRSTLAALVRAHVTAVPFENLDVQLGRRLTTAPSDAYAKIVERRRGGWCYEQNGLFGWVLAELGFEVTRVAAAVMRQDRGDIAKANHLCLLVGIPGKSGRQLVDVGFGGSLLEPLELAEGEQLQTPYRLGLRRLDDRNWRFFEDPGDGEFSYDFEPGAADESVLSAKCDLLQSDPDSSFVLNLVAQIRRPDAHIALRGRVLTISTAEGKASRTLDSAGELLDTLDHVFGLRVPEIGDTWQRIVERHDVLFGPEV